MNIKHFLLWLPMIAIAFANATLRELVFTKRFSEILSHQLSTLTLILFCAVYVRMVFVQLDIGSAKQALMIGFVWMMMTVIFEFTLGRLTNKSWEYLLQNYNILTGHIWPVFLLALFLLPYLFYVLLK